MEYNTNTPTQLSGMVLTAIYELRGVINERDFRLTEDWLETYFTRQSITIDTIDVEIELQKAQSGLFSKGIPSNYVPALRNYNFHGKPMLQISVSAPNEHEGGPPNIQEGYHRLDRAVMALGLAHNPAIFSRRLFRGPIWTGRKGFGEAMFRPMAAPTQLDPNFLLAHISQPIRNLESNEKKTLAGLTASYYVRAYNFSTREQMFLDLWMIVDILVIKGETSKWPKLGNELSRITGIDAEDLNSRLSIKQLSVLRGSIAHTGQIPKRNEPDFSKHLSILDSIVKCLLRDLAGLPFDGELRIHLR